MAPKRSFIPLFLFLLLSLSALFLFSLYHSSLPLSSSSSLHSYSSPTFNPNPNPNFTLTIKVLAFDRLASFSRCLRSLAAAHYGTDRVNLHVFIDHFKKLDDHGSLPLNLDRKLNESHQILEFVDGFSWKFGEKMVHYRTGNVGLQGQWLEAWWPSSDHDFAFVVEDDLEVSPLYYTFIRALILNYYYNASNFSPWVYGASLQRPRFVPGKHGNKMQLDRGTHLFLYQLVGTWGQLLFPRPWKEFRLWYDTHKSKGTKPFLWGMVTTGWYKKMGERIWTPWFIKFIHAHGYFNIYTNFLNERALSVSHRDAGVNYGKTAGPDSYILDGNSLDFNFLEMQPLSDLRWYDFCFREIIPGRVVRSSDELGSVIHSLQKLETIVLVSLYGASETVTRNLLCHFERLNIRNYIIMGPKSSFLLDLVRRGHPVIDVDQFFESVKAHESMGFREYKLEVIKEILVKACVIKKSLEVRYNTWVLDGDLLPVSSDSFVDSFDTSYDFYVGKISTLLFVRSSSSAWKFWVGNFMYNVAVMVDAKTKKDSVSTEGSNFLYVVAKLLEQKGVKFKKLDEISFGVNINASNVNQTSLGDGKKIAFLPSEMGSDLIQKRLEELGMWIVDRDSSCTAVVCHPS